MSFPSHYFFPKPCEGSGPGECGVQRLCHAQAKAAAEDLPCGHWSCHPRRAGQSGQQARSSPRARSKGLRADLSTCQPGAAAESPNHPPGRRMRQLHDNEFCPSGFAYDPDTPNKRKADPQTEGARPAVKLTPVTAPDGLLQTGVASSEWQVQGGEASCRVPACASRAFRKLSSHTGP